MSIIASVVLALAATDVLHGRALALFDRVDGTTVRTAEESRTVSLRAWRGERVQAQVAVWSDAPQGNLALAAGDLTGPDGAVIPSANVLPRFLRTVRTVHNVGDTNTLLVGDCLDPSFARWPPEGFRVAWFTVEVPSGARPGRYTGTFTVRGASGSVAFPVGLSVSSGVLPPLAERKFFLDLWQHPWTVAQYYGDRPFSPSHYAHMEPIYRELGRGGQRVIGTAIVDLPWGEDYSHGRADIRTMVTTYRRADRSFRYDFSVFDEFVSFAKRCGLGPQIHMYTILKFADHHIFYYTDEVTGERSAAELVEGTKEYEAFLTPFLKALVAHLREKGWLADARLAIDEAKADRLAKVLPFLERVAPELGIAFASNCDPAFFRGLSPRIDVFSQILWNNIWTKPEREILFTPEFTAMRDERRAAGQTTVFYICTEPRRPNTWFTSPLAEIEWIGLYCARMRYDGFLRWATFHWGNDPFEHPEQKGYPTGEDFLIYPGGLASIRWELLRDAMEDWEKIRVLRERGRVPAALERKLEAFDYPRILTDPPETTRALVESAMDEFYR